MKLLISQGPHIHFPLHALSRHPLFLAFDYAMLCFQVSLQDSGTECIAGALGSIPRLYGFPQVPLEVMLSPQPSLKQEISPPAPKCDPKPNKKLQFLSSSHPQDLPLPLFLLHLPKFPSLRTLSFHLFHIRKWAPASLVHLCWVLLQGPDWCWGLNQASHV